MEVRYLEGPLTISSYAYLIGGAEDYVLKVQKNAASTVRFREYKHFAEAVKKLWEAGWREHSMEANNGVFCLTYAATHGVANLIHIELAQ